MGEYESGDWECRALRKNVDWWGHIDGDDDESHRSEEMAQMQRIKAVAIDFDIGRFTEEKEEEIDRLFHKNKHIKTYNLWR